MPTAMNMDLHGKTRFCHKPKDGKNRTVTIYRVDGNYGNVTIPVADLLKFAAALKTKKETK